MNLRLATTRDQDRRFPAGPVHRSIIALDLEGSTKRPNPVKGELRRVMYNLLDSALQAAGIGAEHLEELADRGDGVLVLIRPHDNVPKTALLSRFIPALTALLIQYNRSVTDPVLAMRLRIVVHAGEVHQDRNGFYGEDLDIAFRLLDSAPVKKILKDTRRSPLVLVVSEEIFTGIVRHGYVDPRCYERRVRLRVANRQCQGWIHIPVTHDEYGPSLESSADDSFHPRIRSRDMRADQQFAAQLGRSA